MWQEEYERENPPESRKEWNMLWNPPIPSKIRVFLWRACMLGPPSKQRTSPAQRHPGAGSLSPMRLSR